MAAPEVKLLAFDASGGGRARAGARVPGALARGGRARLARLPGSARGRRSYGAQRTLARSMCVARSRAGGARRGSRAGRCVSRDSVSRSDSHPSCAGVSVPGSLIFSRSDGPSKCHERANFKTGPLMTCVLIGGGESAWDSVEQGPEVVSWLHLMFLLTTPSVALWCLVYRSDPRRGLGTFGPPESARSRHPV